MKLRHTLLLAAVLVSGAMHSHGEDILLRLTPSDSAGIIAKIDANSKLIKDARPALDTDKAEQGWQWLEYTTTLKGYIPTGNLSKNFELTTDTTVRTAPSARAQVLTTITHRDSFEVTASTD